VHDFGSASRRDAAVCCQPAMDVVGQHLGVGSDSI
jgi:hypothetical protein